MVSLLQPRKFQCRPPEMAGGVEQAEQETEAERNVAVQCRVPRKCRMFQDMQQQPESTSRKSSPGAGLPGGIGGTSSETAVEISLH
jgi:hypothetical protein